ncbi:hypothetical protein [Aliarcobacter trophiarum]|uniref:hypothetical protein n=1 Tax=Aliarcobacter trophiarum TaxID=708186 RepID=UPI00100A667F|nr:hypothetical protein [Aliarcobacter trophiarum]RXI27846.1 hypothetical protein CRU89_03370 [Aliarcobacter trophiarum]
MLLERYALKLRKNVNHANIFNININEAEFSNISIDGTDFEMSNKHSKFEFDNSSFENLIVIYTKPAVINTIEGRNLYKFKLGYVKTKNSQLIVNVQNWDVVNHLNKYQGLIDFIDIYMIPYDNIAKIAVEYKYNSISLGVLYEVIKDILIINFIDTGIDYNQKLELVKDYFQTDFENTFNNSRKNKKIILYLDTVNNGSETINSVKTEFSVKSDITFENAFSYLKTVSNDNVLRYSIKCEDEDFKTSSIDGYNEDLKTNEWSKPARIQVAEENIQTISDFLRFQ